MNNIESMILGATEFMDGLSRILSLGFWCPYLEMKYLSWHTRKAMTREILERSKKERSP